MFDGLRLALKEPQQERGRFDGLDIGGTAPTVERGIFTHFRPPAPDHDPVKAAQVEREQTQQLAVERHARAVSATWKMQDQGLPVLPHQRAELDRAREELGAISRHAVKDMEQAYSRDASLVPEASGGRLQRVMRAMQLEAEIRIDPERRAGRFVENWQKLDREYRAAYAQGDYDTAGRVRGDMGAMAKSLERDPQMESVLSQQRDRLGIDFDTGRKLSHDLAGSVGIGRDHDRGLSR